MNHCRAWPILLCLLPEAALAHGLARAQDAGLLGLLDWSSVLILLMLGALYLRGALWLRRRRPSPSPARHRLFLAGWLLLCVALLPPVDSMAGELFSVHMVQHELLMLLAAPLLVLSRPGAFLLRGLGSLRRPLLRATRGQMPTLRRLFLQPIMAWLLHAIALWLWHVPTLFELSLRSEAMHTLQHVSFLGSALIFWAACAGRLRHNPGMGVYLLTTAAHTSMLGALLSFSQRLWYPVYEQTAPLWGLSALQDQQLGGLIMWVPGGLLFTALSLYSLMTALALQGGEQKEVQRTASAPDGCRDAA